jgi:hypothetical protein
VEPVPFFNHPILEEESYCALPSNKYMLTIGHRNVHVGDGFVRYEVSAICCHVVGGARINAKELVVIKGVVGDGTCHVTVR